MALNLSRNTKVYFSTNTGTTGFTAANTFELLVMDGYSFSQSTEAQTIQVNEAGQTPNRGQRAFNSALNAVDWSFGTYLRPSLQSTYVTGTERHLWNALAGHKNVVPPASYKDVANLTRSGSTATATVTAHGLAVGEAFNLYGATDSDWDGSYVVATAPDADTFTYLYDVTPSATTSAATSAKVSSGQWHEFGTNFAALSFANSNQHTLTPFTLIFKVDNVYYRITSCVINEAAIDFNLDGIAMVNWSGFGATVAELTGTGTTEIATSATAAYSNASFITNKLSTVTLKAGIGGTGASYVVPLTGGNITISNNVQYLTPEILGIVNKPIGYFTGTRSITGTLNAYLRTGGTDDTAKLLNDILASVDTASETKYYTKIEIGGIINTPRVELEMAGCMLQVPTVEIQDIVSTTVNFTAQGYTPGTQVYDITRTNEAAIKYYATAA